MILSLYPTSNPTPTRSRTKYDPFVLFSFFFALFFQKTLIKRQKKLENPKKPSSSRSISRPLSTSPSSYLHHNLCVCCTTLLRSSHTFQLQSCTAPIEGLEGLISTPFLPSKESRRKRQDKLSLCSGASYLSLSLVRFFAIADNLLAQRKLTVPQSQIRTRCLPPLSTGLLPTSTMLP